MWVSYPNFRDFAAGDVAGPSGYVVMLHPAWMARVGSMRVARSAGRRMAIQPVAPRITTTAANVAGSLAVTP